MSTSPGLHSASAAMNARLSSGPQSQVSATPTNDLPTSRWIRQSSAPVPFIASTMKAVGVRKRSTISADGRSIDGAKTIGGGSSIIGGLVAKWEAGSLALRRPIEMHVPPHSGNHRATQTVLALSYLTPARGSSTL